MTDPFRDGRKDRLGTFVYGPKESPDYVEYIPESFKVMDLYFDTQPGTPDALRLVKLLKNLLHGVPNGTDSC